MSETKDGGYAFPVPEENYLSDGTYSNPGMSLRDYFAGQALAGLLAANATYGGKTTNRAALAIDSYLTADAMIAERDK